MSRKSPKASQPTASPIRFVYTVDVDPLVDAVRQRVDLKPHVAEALRADFRRMFEQAIRRPEQSPATSAASAPGADDLVLTTQGAADLVGVSRPFMVARIDAGDIPLHQHVGNQRRVLRSAVLEWHNREQRKRRAAFQRLGQSLDDEMSSY